MSKLNASSLDADRARAMAFAGAYLPECCEELIRQELDGSKVDPEGRFNALASLCEVAHPGHGVAMAMDIVADSAAQVLMRVKARRLTPTPPSEVTVRIPKKLW